MSKVITFSRVFPAYHPKKGQPTYFVEQIYNSIYCDVTGDWSDAIESENKGGYIVELEHKIKGRKHHTIRAGNRFKVGDKFSPRVWSGKPYQSKQIIIAPDIEVKKVWEFEIKTGISKKAGSIYLDNRLFAVISRNALFTENDSWNNLKLLSLNDGLDEIDLLDWFNFPKPFAGQIICWNENINY